MLRPSPDAKVFLYAGPVDMRKSIDGLSALVEHELAMNPMQPALFVFCNKPRDKIELLYWERNGFVLWYKRLEKQRFKWLKPDPEQTHLRISGQQLNQLLDGLDLFNNRPHRTLCFEAVS